MAIEFGSLVCSSRATAVDISYLRRDQLLVTVPTHPVGLSPRYGAISLWAVTSCYGRLPRHPVYIRFTPHSLYTSNSLLSDGQFPATLLIFSCPRRNFLVDQITPTFRVASLGTGPVR